MGGRMSLTANLGLMLRKKMNEAAPSKSPQLASGKASQELKALEPLFSLQRKLSIIPKKMNY
jgi:ATP-dependent Lhr-like helicase